MMFDSPENINRALEGLTTVSLSLDVSNRSSIPHTSCAGQTQTAGPAREIE